MFGSLELCGAMSLEIDGLRPSKDQSSVRDSMGVILLSLSEVPTESWLDSYASLDRVSSMDWMDTFVILLF